MAYTVYLTTGIEGVYILAAILFIVALRQMSNPATARRGIVAAGLGVLVAILVTFVDPGILGSGLSSRVLM